MLDFPVPDLIGGQVNCASIRIWNPVAVEKTEICSWVMVEKDAPAAFKKSSYEAYVRSFGGSGAFEQDDVQAWCGATQTTKGIVGRNLMQNISGGMTDRLLDSNFPGPGEASVGFYSDANWRTFYKRWIEDLSGDML